MIAVSSLIACCAITSAASNATLADLKAYDGAIIAVREDDECYVIHFHAVFSDCAGKQGVARVRCVTGVGDDSHTTWLTSVAMRIDHRSESWNFYVRVPRYSDKEAVYQVEIGVLTPDDVNDAEIFDTRAIKITNDGVFLATTVPIPRKTKRIVDSEVIIETVFSEAAAERTDSETFRLVSEFVDGEKAGEGSAVRFEASDNATEE